MSADIRYSVIVPMYNEEEVIEATYSRLSEVMETLDERYELIFVNDGSRDRTRQVVLDLCRNDPRVRLLSFSRNFGHQIAISAGMDHAQGQAVIVIDADLQDPPEVIPEMIRLWKTGYDVVYGQRIKRNGETLFKKWSAALFYRLFRSLTSFEIPVDTGDFRLIDRKVCDTLKGLKEKNRYVRGLVSWIGFRQTAVRYVREQRWAGETKYPLRKMLRFASDAIVSFSFKPLRLASYLGFTLSGLSFLYLMVVLWQKLFTDTTIVGWASLIALNLFFNGIMLMILGIIGEYIGRIYDESKGRPLYVLQEKIGFDEHAASEPNRIAEKIVHM
ncbi:glycosyltransferase family 2 protein [Paenibacillus hamazuiensis]|uniref:glycosyltransferase family 2 protein n=1 Tax=Paenibacillus hamazuiensis TaxID=2936508 RepID=UPI00200E2604|nr:glycosyltransferase family 2 protein [Paenibacillus hamazuiensis]